MKWLEQLTEPGFTRDTTAKFRIPADHDVAERIPQREVKIRPLCAVVYLWLRPSDDAMTRRKRDVLCVFGAFAV